MKMPVESWMVWALLSAVFAAGTAILAKIGVTGVNSNFATFIRTVVILAFLCGFLAVTRQFQSLGSLSRRTVIFLVLSGLATGLSWLCYFRALQLGPVAQVAPIDKLSLVLVAVLGVLFLGENLQPQNWVGVVLMAAGALLLAIRR